MENMLMNPAQLTQMGQVPFYLMPEAHEWMKQAQSADKATLDEIMAKRQHEAQLRPLQLNQQQATLDQLMLGNEGKRLDLQKQRALQPKQIDAELAKLVAEADERDWQQTVRDIHRGMQSGSAEAMKLYQQLPEMVKLREEHKNKMLIEQEQTKRAYGVANIGAAARVASATKPNDFLTTLNTKYKNIGEKYGAIKAELARLQATEPDSSLISQLAVMEEALRPLVQEQLDKGATAGGLTQDTNGKWVVRPALQLGGPADNSPANPANKPKPTDKPQPSKAPTQADLEFTAKKYGITVEEVKRRLGIK